MPKKILQILDSTIFKQHRKMHFEDDNTTFCVKNRKI